MGLHSPYKSRIQEYDSFGGGTGYEFTDSLVSGGINNLRTKNLSSFFLLNSYNSL